MMLMIDIDVMERGRMRREVQGSDKCSDKCSVGSRFERGSIYIKFRALR